jgi:hypothetical protein
MGIAVNTAASRMAALEYRGIIGLLLKAPCLAGAVEDYAGGGCGIIRLHGTTLLRFRR